MVPIFDFTDQMSANLELLNQVFSLAIFCVLIHLVTRFFSVYLIDLGRSLALLVTAGAAGIFALALTMYFWSTMDESSFFLTLVISLIVGLSVFHPAIAMTSVCSLLLLRSWEIRPDLEMLNILPRVLLLAFAVSYILAALRGQRFKLRLSKVQFGLFALGIWVFLSTMVTANSVDSQAAFFDGFFKSLVIFVLIFQIIREKRDYETLVGSMAVSVFSLAVVALLNTFVVRNVPRLELFGALKNSNDLAAMFIFILPFVLRPLWQKRSSALGIIRNLIFAMVIFAGIWKSQSRAAYLALFCMGGIWLAYRFRQRKLMLVSGLVAGSLILAILSGLQLGRESTDLEGSKQNRLGYWKAGVAMTLRNPALGVGYGRFPYHFREYGASFTEYGARTAHSSWILLVAEAGIPALVIFVTLFAMAFHRAWQLAGEAPELLASLTGYGVAMSFLSHVYTLYPYILLALIFSYPKKEVSR